jgi:hypothetical protein
VALHGLPIFNKYPPSVQVDIDFQMITAIESYSSGSCHSLSPSPASRYLVGDMLQIGGLMWSTFYSAICEVGPLWWTTGGLANRFPPFVRLISRVGRDGNKIDITSLDPGSHMHQEVKVRHPTGLCLREYVLPLCRLLPFIDSPSSRVTKSRSPRISKGP